MIHAIKIGGFVLADANRPGQGIIATHVNQLIMDQTVLWNAVLIA